MKTKIDLSQWNRKDHFHFFKNFEEPFFGITASVDCTKAYAFSRKSNTSFFLCYLHAALSAANQIENFRYRILEDEVWLYDQVDASPTIHRPDGTFGFAYMQFENDFDLFHQKAKLEIESVQSSTGLTPALTGENVIHFSSIPWINFTALSHARYRAQSDSIPKISFGKMSNDDGRCHFPVSVHAHHGLMDGAHVGDFLDRFGQLLNTIEK